MNKTGVIVINLNTYGYTRRCIEDLLKQNVPFDLTLVDQASQEAGIREFFESVRSLWGNRGKLTIKYNTINEPLNEVWNTFAKESDNEYLCYLNSDVRIPCNFIKDSESVFSLEPTVGVTVHSTNHPHWLDSASHQLNYKIPPIQKIKQGWDFTIRKSDWEIIPEILQIFCGDDFIFYKCFIKDRKVAYILSSPILHFQGMSQGKNYREKLPPRKDNFKSDVSAWASLGWPVGSTRKINDEYTRIKPTLDLIQRYEKGIL